MMRWVGFGLVSLSVACQGNGDDDGGDGDSSSSSGGSGAGGSGAGELATGGSGTAGSGGSPSGGTTGSGGTTPGDDLSSQYPGDVGIQNDPSVIFFDDFESGWGRWDAPMSDTDHLFIESGSLSHSGSGYLRSTVTVSDLEIDEYISSSTRLDFARTTETLFFRFYAQFKGISVTPHHWVRIAAGDEDFNSSGLANTVPAGDDGFWFDFDANTDDVFNFYVYWYNMRSGRCNDGTAVVGCEGDQGNTYYYGNIFRPPEQEPFPRDEWICIEMMAHANSVGSSDGALAFWVNDEIIGDYRPGFPDGTWLRDTFHTGGCEYSACTPPEPFEGFDFRSDDAVEFKSIFLDAYYERDSTANKRATLEDRGLTVLDEQTIYYDDVVVADSRIGCQK